LWFAFENIYPLKEDLSVCSRYQSGDQPDRGRFSTPGFSNQRQYLTSFHAERSFFNGMHHP